MCGVIGPCVSLNRHNQYVSDSVSDYTHIQYYNVQQTHVHIMHLYENNSLFCIIHMHIYEKNSLFCIIRLHAWL